ncbi:uncharacterized protein [Watersipora subatra]|uniref:uncharacterized protein n=1 Tax=Watersipora subatra TaxID=2589382 RepID=UPI00355B1B3C
MLLKIGLMLSSLVLSLSAPIDKCKDDLECLYKLLEADADHTKLPPCKRMFNRHGKRSIDDQDCKEDDEVTTTPTEDKRVFLERLIKRLEAGEDGYPKVASSLTQETRKENSQDSIRTDALSSQLQVLRQKINRLEGFEDQRRMTTVKQFEHIEISDDVRYRLTKIQEDLDALLPLIPQDESVSNLEDLDSLSQQLAVHDNEDSLPRESYISTTSSSKIAEILESRLENLEETVERLIEVDLKAYRDLENKIESLKPDKM